MIMRVFRRRKYMPDRLFAMPLVVHIGLILVLAISVAVVFGIGLWWGIGQPSITTDKPWTAKESFDFLKIVLAVVGGIGGVVALVVSYRKQRLGETAEQRNQKAEERNQQAEAREDARLFAEDFGRAAEQLGSNEAPVRLAGMYTLERLAQNTPEQRQTVVNVFCAYLRMPYTPPEDDPAEEHQHDNERRKHEREVRLTAQRILATNLCPNSQTGDYWKDINLDLTGATLINFDFNNCRINTARFDSAHFSEEAVFDGAQFHQNASFDETQFHGDANFHGVQFHGDANFHGVQFHGDANFRGVQFHQGTSFYAAQFHQNASFNVAQFHQIAEFKGVQFHQETSFHAAQFCEITSFRGVQFHQGTSFHAARVRLDVHDNVLQNRTCPPGYTVTEPASLEEASLPDREGRWGYLTRVESDEEDTPSLRSFYVTSMSHGDSR